MAAPLRIKGGRFLFRWMAGGVIVAGVGAVPFHLFLGPDGLRSWLWGAGISLFNCLWGTLLILWGVDRSNTAYLGSVLGGFLGRFVVALSMFYVLQHQPGIHAVILALSIVGFYFLGMILEIHFLHKEVLNLRATRREGRTTDGCSD